MDATLHAILTSLFANNTALAEAQARIRELEAEVARLSAANQDLNAEIRQQLQKRFDTERQDPAA